jgi:molybdate transport system substrate-binding protein
MPRRLLLAPVALLALLALVGGACGGDDPSSTAPPPPTSTAGSAGDPAPAAPRVTGDVTVLAAASLTESFTKLAATFRSNNPGTTVTLGFAGSAALAAQIDQGAPADVFASADTATMDKVARRPGAGTAAPPVPFATNTLQVIVGKGNPKGITSLADLAKPGVVYVTAAANVPIGAYARQALQKAGVTVTPKSLEADVKGIVSKVTLGEADAGIVYASDVLAAGDKAQGVAIPDAQNVVAAYPIAVLKNAKNPGAAAAFVAFVTGDEGQAILSTYGFSPA